MNKILIPLLLISFLSANEFSVNPSFQGYTGVINTPNAQVIKDGHAVFHINNQFDNSVISYNYDTSHSSQEDYILGFGLFDFIEFQGRLSETGSLEKYNRDLSANIKIQLPYHHKYLPDLAIGMQDLGGAANKYDNNYIVLDKELYFLRASLGYGVSSVEDETKKRMNGLFAALEVKATDWFYLMLEDDSQERHVGLRVEMPKSWIDSFNLGATVSQNITSNETSFGLSVDIPLYHESVTNPIKYTTNNTKPSSDTTMKESTSLNIQKPQEIKTHISTLSLQTRLANFGFENIRVAKDETTVYVEAENAIFDHTDLDALGYIIGTISNSDFKQNRYSVTLLKNSIKTLSISGDFESFNNYLQEPSATNKLILSNNLSYTRNSNDSNISYSQVQNSSRFIPRVELSLGLITTVGTEVGIVDYLASLKTNVYMNLYDGLVVSALYEVPFANSDDFDPGGAFYSRYSQFLENRLVNAMVHQTFRVQNFINTLSIGKYQTDYLGFLNQADYTTTSGNHALRWKSGYFTNDKNSLDPDKSFSLATYRYAYSPLDLYLESTYGKFWSGDVGTQLEFKKFYGETSIALNYKYTSLQDIPQQFAGIEISFPMTTRKLYKANYVQVKGKKDFSYSLKSTINSDNNRNNLSYNRAITPQSDFEITTQYLNRDRLSSSYVNKHLDRLRDAYLTYKNTQ